MRIARNLILHSINFADTGTAKINTNNVCNPEQTEKEKKNIHPTNLHLNFCSSEKPQSPSAIIMFKAKKLRSLAGKILNESLKCSKRHIQRSVLPRDLFLALPQESKYWKGGFLLDNERFMQIVLQIAVWYFGFVIV